MVTEQVLKESRLTRRMLEDIRDRTLEEVTATFNLFINMIPEEES